jgi:glucokinase
MQAPQQRWQVMVGRPPVVLGLDFGGTKIAVAVCDLQGNRLASATVSAGTADGIQPGSPGPAAAQAGADRAAAGQPGPGQARADETGSDGRAPAGHDAAQAVFQRGVRTARGLLATAAPGSDLAAVGASTFGIPYDDRVELAPAIPGWEDLELGRELRAAFGGAEIRMATDAKAAAAAEARWGALHGCDPGVYLNLGTGLSAAVVTGGQVITGGQGAAGEFGYNLRTVSDVGLALGERTMLEEMVSGLALARRASGQPGRPPRLTAADVFAAGPGDRALSELIEEFTAELAFHLVNLAILVNPVRIAVGGGLVRSWDRIAPRLRGALDAGAPFPPELVVGHFPYDAPLLGAVALAVDAATGIASAGGMTGTIDPATAGAATSITGAAAGLPAGAGTGTMTPVAAFTTATGVTERSLNNNTGVTA